MPTLIYYECACSSGAVLCRRNARSKISVAYCSQVLTKHVRVLPLFESPLNPFRTPVPFWGQTIPIPSNLPPIVPKTRLQSLRGQACGAGVNQEKKIEGIRMKMSVRRYYAPGRRVKKNMWHADAKKAGLCVWLILLEFTGGEVKRTPPQKKTKKSDPNEKNKSRDFSSRISTTKTEFEMRSLYSRLFHVCDWIVNHKPK